MNTRKHSLLAAAAALALVAGVAPAMAHEAAAAPGAAHGAVNGHASRTAALQDHKLAAMKGDKKDSDLRLSFNDGWRRARLNDVKLDIYDQAHKDVFSRADARARTDVQLPPGNYRIVARAGGIERSKQVDLKPGASKHVSLHWPGSVAKAAKA